MIWDRVFEPDKRLKPEVNAARIFAFVDTNFIGDESESVAFLWRCRAEGWIRFQKTDVVDTEHLTMKPELDYKRDLSSELAESLTPFVLDHSRLDAAVLGSRH